MKKGPKEGLHGFDTVRGRLLAKEGVQTNHGTKKGHCTTHDGDAMKGGPVLHVFRNRRVRGPENRRLGKGDGETKGRGEDAEAVEKGSHLIKGPNNSNVISVGQDGEVAEAF